jgi:hypothetical protein
MFNFYLQSWGPNSGQGGVGFQNPQTEEQGSSGHEGRGEVGNFVFKQGDLDQVLCHGVLEHVHIASFGVSAEEMKGEGPGKIESDGVEKLQLHLADLGRTVGIVRDVDKVVDLRGVHLLNLAGDEHGGNSDQLELIAADC